MFESPDIVIDYTLDKGINRRLNIFWMGFTIYTAVFAIGAGLTRTYSINPILQLIGFLALIPTSIGLIRYKFDSNYLAVIYTLYCIWLLSIIIRGLPFDTPYTQFLLFNGDFGILPYFVPLVLLFPRDLEFYKKLFNVITIFGILYLVYDILFAKILLSSDRTPNLVNQNAVERFTKCLSIPIGFLLFTFNYHSKKRKLFAIGIILIDLLLTIYRARRGLVFICSTTIVFSFLLYLVLSRTKLLIVVFSILLAFFALNFISAYTHNKNNIFTFLVERSEEDTRTPVEECLFADMGTQDWVIGKGLKGDYYCPYVDEDDITGYRDSIETDYLNIILKGGVINLGLLLLILVPAIFKGLFYSRNTLSKAAALWILLWMICLYPANVATFTLNYILVWISVGICYSRDIRNMPDEVLKEYFKVKTR